MQRRVGIELASVALLGGVALAAPMAGCAFSSELRCASAPPIASAADPQVHYVPIRPTALDQSCRAVCDQIQLTGSASQAEIEALIERVAHVDEAPVLSISFTERVANHRAVRSATVTTGDRCTGTGGGGSKYDLELNKGGWRITSAASWGG